MRTALFIFLVSVFTSLVSAASASKFELAHQVFVESGMQTQSHQIPDAIVRGFDDSLTDGDFSDQFPAHAIPGLRAAFRDTFSARILERSVVESMARSLSSDTLQKVLRWYRSDSGVRIRQAEVVNSTLANTKERLRFIDQIKPNAASIARMAAIQDLEKSWQVTETSVSMMINMQVAVTSAVISVLPTAEQVSVQHLTSLYESGRARLEAHFSAETLASMLYIYRDIPTEVLRQYSDFAQSEVGLDYVESSNDALQASMLESSVRLGNRIALLLRRDVSADGI